MFKRLKLGACIKEKKSWGIKGKRLENFQRLETL